MSEIIEEAHPALPFPQRHENRKNKYQSDNGEQHAAHYAYGERVPEFFGFPVEKERQQAEHGRKNRQQGRDDFPVISLDVALYGRLTGRVLFPVLKDGFNLAKLALSSACTP